MSSPDKFHQFASTSTVRGDLKNRSVLGVFSTAVGSGLDFILRLASISVLAHLVIPEHFGLVGMVTAVTAIGSQIVHLGLGTATIQRPDIDHRQVSTLFWINVAFGLVLTLILAAAAPWLAGFFQDARLIPITIAIGSSFFWSGLSVQHEALLTRQMQQGAMAVVRVGAMLGSAGLAVGLALAGYGYWALVWQEVSRAALLTFGFWYFCRWMPGMPSRSAGIGTFLSFGWHMTLTQLLNAFVLNLDRVLLGRFFGAEPVGLYGRAQQLILAPVEQLNAPIQSVAQPALSLLQSDPERFRRYFRKIVLIIGLATMPFAVAGGVYAHEATYLVLGPEWDHAAILFLIFAFWAFIRPVLGMAGVVLISLGQSKRLLNYSYVRQVVFIILTLVGLKWGMVGVAIAQVGSTYLLLIPCLVYSFAQSPVSTADFFRAIRTPALASLLMGGALVALRHAMPDAGMIAGLAAGAALGGIVYAGAVLLLPGDRQEVMELARSALDMVRRKIRRGAA